MRRRRVLGEDYANNRRERISKERNIELLKEQVWSELSSAKGAHVPAHLCDGLLGSEEEDWEEHCGSARHIEQRDPAAEEATCVLFSTTHPASGENATHSQEIAGRDQVRARHGSEGNRYHRGLHTTPRGRERPSSTRGRRRRREN